MKGILLCLVMFMFAVTYCCGQLHQPTFKLADTTGLAGIETRITEFELILKNNTDNVSTMSNLNNIKVLANMDAAISDTLLNHLVPIFDGYNTLHSEQGQLLKDISDLSENILGTKSLAKAQKYNQQIIKQYAKLLLAK